MIFLRLKAKAISKILKIVFWACMAVWFVDIAIKDISRDRSPHPVFEASVNTNEGNPPCKNSRNQSVEFVPHQHGRFAEYKLSGLTLISDDLTVDFDYDELSKAPVEYRDFILRAACARSILGDRDNPGRVSPPAEVVQAADCQAVKRLRDENYSSTQIAVIAEQIALDKSVSQADAEKRTANLRACYDAPK